MFDKLRKRIRAHRPRIDIDAGIHPDANPSPDPSSILNIPVPNPSSLPSFKTYQGLHAASPRTTARKYPVAWQLPLPFDVMLAVVNDIFLHQEDSATTIRNLTETCLCLADLCRPVKYHTMTVKPSPFTDEQYSPSEKFAILISISPDIIGYIKNLRVLTTGDEDTRVNDGNRNTPRQEALYYILTRQFPKLMRLELDFRREWNAIPVDIQLAFQATFSLPTLREVMFSEHFPLSMDFFVLFKNLSAVEVRGTQHILSQNVATSSESPLLEDEAYCTPSRLLFVDSSNDGSGTVKLFDKESRLRLTNLKRLQAYTRCTHVNLLRNPIDSCSRTLTTLEIYVSTVWRSSPRVPWLNLQSLHALRDLTLSANVMPNGQSGHNSLARFSWLVSTLESCPDPNRIEDISIIIGTRSIELTKTLPWNRLAALFGPNISDKWPKLAIFDLHVNSENEEDLRQYKEGSLDVVVRQRMRVFSTNVLRIRVSGERLGFWSQ